MCHFRIPDYISSIQASCFFINPFAQPLRSHAYLSNMKLSLAIGHLAVLGVVHPQANADYNQICPSKNGTSAEIVPGYYIEYKCGILGPNNGRPLHNVGTDQACA